MITRSRSPIIMKQFNPREGDVFSAYNDAEKWLSGFGYSVGSMQRGAPTAAFIGDCDVSKWRGLNKQERAAIDAKIHDMGKCSFRGGSVEVLVYALTQAMQEWASSLNT